MLIMECYDIYVARYMLQVIVICTMDTSGLPMYTRSPRAEAVHITAVCYRHSSGMPKAAIFVLQLHNLIPQSNLTSLPILS